MRRTEGSAKSIAASRQGQNVLLGFAPNAAFQVEIGNSGVDSAIPANRANV